MEPVFFQEQLQNYYNDVGTVIYGSVPQWLQSGIFLKNGPGLFEAEGKKKLNHFFDGFSKVQTFYFDPSGKVQYSSKFLDSNSYFKSIQHRSLVYSEFGTTVRPKNVFLRLLSRLHPFVAGLSDNCNIAGIDYNGYIYIVGEGLKLFRFDPRQKLSYSVMDELKLLKQKRCRTFMVACAHWQVDKTPLKSSALEDDKTETEKKAKEIQMAEDNIPVVGRMYGFGIARSNSIFWPFRRFKNKLLYLDENEKATIVAKIPMEKRFLLNYNHSFSVTPNFIVFIRQPIKLDMIRMMKGNIRGGDRGVSESLILDETECSTIFVICKHTGKILGQFKTDHFFFTLHHINCFEEKPEETVVLDCVCFKNLFALNMFFREELVKYSPTDTVLEARCKRFKINVMNPEGPVVCEEISSADVEFPCINDTFYGQDYSYMWCLCRPSDKLSREVVTTYAIGRIAVNERGPQNLVYWFEDGSWPSEPCFVPKSTSPAFKDSKDPKLADETNGAVMATVHCNTGLSYLLVLDGQSMEAMAKVTWPNVLPGLLIGIHSMFVFPDPYFVRNRSKKLQKYDTMMSEVS